MQATCRQGLSLLYSYCILNYLRTKYLLLCVVLPTTNALVILLAQYQQNLMLVALRCCQPILQQQAMNLHHIDNPLLNDQLLKVFCWNLRDHLVTY